jgi:L-ascorbate metabolism protein UlaG (beta-lactamase superfamily)
MRLTWFGHSAFRIEFGAVRIMIDPFIPNPTYKGSAREAAAGCTHVLLTHGHNDHVGAAVEISRDTGAQVVGAAEVCDWFVSRGVAGNKVNPGNHGGTVDCGGFSVSFVNALHSSSYGGDQGAVYLGNPLGLIVAADGQPTLYHMGDTGIFGDMALIAEIYRPEVGLVPIGDRYTMGARLAAMACKRFFKFRTIVPCHYGTFPALDQNPDKFRAELGADADKLLVPERGKPVEL